MTRFIVYGVGSGVLIDVEETAHRAGMEIAHGIRNVEGESYLSESVPVSDLAALAAIDRSLPILVPLFTPGHRQQAVTQAEENGFSNHLVLVDPSALLPRSVAFGPGTYVNAGCTFGAGSRFGAFAFVNRSVTVGHHAKVGRFVSIGPGAVVAGGVGIGDGTLIGAGATVLPSITIGSNAVVGAGSVVTRDVPDECLLMGNPGKIIRRGIGGHKGIRVT